MQSQGQRTFNLQALLLLSFGHMVADVYQGALPAILPFLKERLDLSYAMAGVIIFASNLTSSIIQPLFGLISDKKEKPSLLWAGCLLAGAGFSLLPLAPGYWAVLLLVVISGLGVAAYHPEGFRTASYFTGNRAATGMSIFTVGGNFGFALGPILALSIVTHLGFGWLPLMSVLVIAYMTALSRMWGTVAVPKGAHEHAARERDSGGGWFSASLALLISTVIVRSWIHAGLTSFIPFYYINYMKGDPVMAGTLVSFFLMGGVAGTILGAPIADRWGHKRYLVLSMLAVSLLFPLILLVQGILLCLVLAVFGMVLISTFTVTVVMAQKLMPGYPGMASGLMVGFAIGTGGAGVAVLGVVADHWGVPAALTSIFVLPIIGFVLSMMIRYPSFAGQDGK